MCSSLGPSDLALIGPGCRFSELSADLHNHDVRGNVARFAQLYDLSKYIGRRLRPLSGQANRGQINNYCWVVGIARQQERLDRVGMEGH